MKKLIAKTLSILGLKRIALKSVKNIKWYFTYLINNLFNQLVRNQNKDFKSIPIIIISFNQLFYLKQLIEFLKKHKYNNIVIIDNNSTYPPLLDYFDTIVSTVTIHKLEENLGHLVFWKNKELYTKYSKGYYVITDSDIVPVENCPEDFVLHFKRILDKNVEITKAGFSLKIDDIPDSNPNKQKVIDWESQFWSKQNKAGNYQAPIDTTFALYQPSYTYDEQDFYDAIRTKEPYLAVHGGWYIDNNNLTEEQIYFFEHCNISSSWRIDNKGHLKKSMYLS